MTPIDIPEAPQGDKLYEILEKLLNYAQEIGDNEDKLTVTQAEIAIQDWAYQETLNLIGEDENTSVVIPATSKFDMSEHTWLQRALRRNELKVELRAKAAAKWGKT